MNRYVLSVSRCLIPAFATACLATASLAQQGPPGGLSVNVTNTPLPVTGVVTTSGTINVGNTQALAAAIAAANAQVLRGTPVAFLLQNAGSTFSVPVGQRLVIEYISGTCTVFPKNFLSIGATTNGTKMNHSFSLPVVNGPVAIGVAAEFGDLVKIYADPGTNVVLEGGTDVCVNLTVSGRLVTP